MLRDARKNARGREIKKNTEREKKKEWNAEREKTLRERKTC